MSSGEKIRKRFNINEKKKKDDDRELIMSHSGTKDSNEDIAIHVYREGGTGGGICAKILFFISFTALAIAVGIVLIDSKDLDSSLGAELKRSPLSKLIPDWLLVSDILEYETHHDDEDDEELHFIEHNEEPLASEEVDASSFLPISEEHEAESEENEEMQANSEEYMADTCESTTENLRQTLEESLIYEEIPISQTGKQSYSNVYYNSKEETPENIEEGGEILDDSKTDELSKKHGPGPLRIVIKIGVGVFLLVVAYIVLIKNWKTYDEDNDGIIERQHSDIIKTVKKPLHEEYDSIRTKVDFIGEDEYDERRLQSYRCQFDRIHHDYSRHVDKLHTMEDLDNNDLDIDEVEENYNDNDIDNLDGDDDGDDSMCDINDIDEDDEALLQRLELQYRNLHEKRHYNISLNRKHTGLHINPQWEPDSEDEFESDDPDAIYEYESITNADDWKIQDKLDEAQNKIKHA